MGHGLKKTPANLKVYSPSWDTFTGSYVNKCQCCLGVWVPAFKAGYLRWEGSKGYEEKPPCCIRTACHLANPGMRHDYENQIMPRPRHRSDLNHAHLEKGIKRRGLLWTDLLVGYGYARRECGNYKLWKHVGRPPALKDRLPGKLLSANFGRSGRKDIFGSENSWKSDHCEREYSPMQNVLVDKYVWMYCTLWLAPRYIFVALGLLRSLNRWYLVQAVLPQTTSHTTVP